MATAPDSEREREREHEDDSGQTTERRDYRKTIDDYEQPDPDGPDVTSVYDFNGVVVNTNDSASPLAHAPGAHRDGDVLPLCRLEKYNQDGFEAKSYKFKQPGIIPRNYHPECDRCRDILAEDGA